MDTLLSMRVFCTVAELKSFAAAADRLGVSTAMASKHVMHLEKRLSTRLLNRTSRHVSLTETGALYFEQTRHMLEALQEVEDAVGKTTVTPRGTLRFSAPVWMANPVFTKIFAEYHAQYPEVRFDIDLSGRIVNLVEEGFDLALRATTSPDPGLIARRITDVCFQLVASPDFLKRVGRPKTVAQLRGSPFLAYSYVSPDGNITFSGGATVKFQPVMVTANETFLLLAARSGIGFTVLPSWLIEHDIAERQLELVLPEAKFENPLFGVYPSRKYLSAKVRTFLDFVARRLK